MERMKSFDELLGRYADVTVQVGANVQPGQYVIIRSDIAAAPLVRELARSAYAAGARLVDVWWGDEQVTLRRFQHAPRDSFEEFPTWRTRAEVELLDAGAALISVTANDPELLRGQPQELVMATQRAGARHSAPVLERIARRATNWVIVAAATEPWAAKVFPDAPQGEAAPRLWRAIFDACRLDDHDPVGRWREHVARLGARAAYLNARRYGALRYRGPGTDLTLGLAPGHIWYSAEMLSQAGTPFVANLPTEEVFTMPHRGRVDGTVSSSRPLSVGGSLIDQFSLTFKDGAVVDARAAQGEELLRSLIATDAGAARLGEVALVPERSPIAQSGLLFLNTLFDENAACHLALGSALRFTTEGGEAQDDAAFEAEGGNISSIHIDFMVGSSQLDIDGVLPDGSSEPVMRRGEWAFEG
jgi:aminopeptidase